MRITALFLTGFFILGLALSDGMAQMSKKEKKEWKKKAKTMVKNPEAYKSLVEENASLKSQLSTANRDLEYAESQLLDKEEELAEITRRLQSTQSELMAARKAANEAPKASSTPMDMSGLVFKVQIGAFKNKDLSKYFENSPFFTGGDTRDGMQAITLGYFRDYWEADRFKKYLREMGVKDAWIVPFQDGQRVEMKTVLEQIGAKQG